MANILTAEELSQADVAVNRASLLRATMYRIVCEPNQPVRIPVRVSFVPYVMAHGDHLIADLARDLWLTPVEPCQLNTPNTGDLKATLRGLIHQENALWLSMVNRAFELQAGGERPEGKLLTGSMHIVSTTDPETFIAEHGLLPEPLSKYEWMGNLLGTHPVTRRPVHNLLTPDGQAMIQGGRIITCADPLNFGAYSEQSPFFFSPDVATIHHKLAVVLTNANAVWEGFTADNTGN